MNNMKKLLAAALCLCMLLGLASCQKAAEPVVETVVVTEAPVETTDVTETTEATETVEETETTEATETVEETETAEVTETVEETVTTEAVEVAAPAADAEPVAETAEVTEIAEVTDVPAIPELDDAEVIATVNGKQITWADAKVFYDDYILNYSPYYDMTQQENVDLFRSVSMHNAMVYTVLMQNAEQMGLAPLSEQDAIDADAQADAIWQSNLDYYVSGMYGDITDETQLAAAYEEAVAYFGEMGITQESNRKDYRESIILSGLFDVLTQDVTVSDEDVEKEYQRLLAEDQALYENDLEGYVSYNSYVDQNNMMAMYYGGETMDYAWYRPAGFRNVQHILLSVDESLMQDYQNKQAQLEEQMSSEEGDAAAAPVTQDDVNAAKQAILDSQKDKIDEINQRLANGEDFAALIPEYTLDSDNIYEVSVASTNYVPEFVEAAFSVDNVGDVSAPYISQFGIHIVKYVSDAPAGPLEMTPEQRELKRQSLLEALKNDLYATKVDEWIAASTIEYTGVIPAYEDLLAADTAETETTETADVTETTEVAETEETVETTDAQ